MNKTLVQYLLRIAGYILIIVLACPCLLVFTTGSNGEPTLLNLFGMAYILIFYGVYKYLVSNL